MEKEQLKAQMLESIRDKVVELKSVSYKDCSIYIVNDGFGIIAPYGVFNEAIKESYLNKPHSCMCNALRSIEMAYDAQHVFEEKLEAAKDDILKALLND